MTKTPIVVSEYFVIRTDENGKREEVIYNPPLLAEVGNLRVELRKERNHNKAHIHVIKKCGRIKYDVSVAIMDLEILAGGDNRERFNRREYTAVLKFILENRDLFETLYKELRGDL